MTDPALVYLARLSPGSRRAQAGAIRTLARLLEPDQGGVGPFVVRAPEGGDGRRTEDGGRCQVPYPSTALSASFYVPPLPTGASDYELQLPGEEYLVPTTSYHDTYEQKANISWHLLRPDQVSALRARLVADYAPATARRILAALRGVLRECWRAGLLDADARDRLCDIPPVRGRRLPAGRALDQDALHALREAATDHERGALALLVGGGLRRAELVSLCAGDLSFTEDVLQVKVRGKGDKERTVYLAGALAQDARGYEPGRWRSPGRVWKAIRRLAIRAGVEPLSPHDLRRTFASRSLDAGVDLATVQACMGHADPRTTARYDRRGDDALRRAARRIA